LAWNGVPPGTNSLALIDDDPDTPDFATPTMTWVHCVAYNIPPTASSLPETVKPQALPPGTRTGITDWGHTCYGGPCRSVGRHRYFHKLYALDTLLPKLKRPDKEALEAAMKGHVFAQATLVGNYQMHR
jgi:Raf kinase inhibitor-like YbhB/YbcL family protein